MSFFSHCHARIFIPLFLLGIVLISNPASGAEELPGRTTFPRLASETVNFPLPGKTAAAPELPRLFPGNVKKLEVVVDPGHGGKDWGTVGVCNLLEKNLVLDIGRLLFEILNSDPRFEAALTRDIDAYLTLANRKRLAQYLAADLFVSIHANWGERITADGPEVFFMNIKPTDEAALEVALKENREIKAEEKPLDREPILEAILKDLTETSSLKKSSELAEIIYKELRQSLPGEFRGVKQAPFMVLNGVTRPAILIEVGFLSNQEDCYFLSTDYGKRIIAEKIAEGIRKFGLMVQEERNLKDRQQKPTINNQSPTTKQ
ncbi:MAG: N-acetylmuramoyl-L-alanine amidase [bacterium]|nr:N-acetylmuramoyl-L-alanine amidase [bacterium]